MLSVVIYVVCIYVDWWLYMFYAYKLLVIMYAMCIFVVGEILLHAIEGELLVWACIGLCRCGLVKFVWSMFCCCRVLVHTHTQLLLAFISMLVLNTYVFIMRVVMMCLLHQGRRPRRWKLVPHAARVGLDMLHVLGRVVFANVLRWICCWCICVFCDWLQLTTLMLIYLLMRMIYAYV